MTDTFVRFVVGDVIDLDERNAWLARDRVGLWLDLEAL